MWQEAFGQDITNPYEQEREQDASGGGGDNKSELVPVNMPGFDSPVMVPKEIANDPKALSKYFSNNPYLLTKTGIEKNPYANPVQGYNIDAAVVTLNKNAGLESQQMCGQAIGKSLQAGGINGAMADGKDYGPILLKNDFGIVGANDYSPEKGDFAIYDGNSTHKWGHGEEYNGDEWVSDFFQGWIGFRPGYEYGGRGFMVYSIDIPRVTIYRYGYKK